MPIPAADYMQNHSSVMNRRRNRIANSPANIARRARQTPALQASSAPPLQSSAEETEASRIRDNPKVDTPIPQIVAIDKEPAAARIDPTESIISTPAAEALPLCALASPNIIVAAELQGASLIDHLALRQSYDNLPTKNHSSQIVFEATGSDNAKDSRLSSRSSSTDFLASTVSSKPAVSEHDVALLKASYMPSLWRSSKIVLPVLTIGYIAAAAGMMAASLLFLPWVIAPFAFWSAPIFVFTGAIHLGRRIWQSTPTRDELKLSIIRRGDVAAEAVEGAPLTGLVAETGTATSYAEKYSRYLLETKIARGQHASIGAGLGAAIGSGLAWSGLLIPIGVPYIALAAVVVGGRLAVLALR